MACEEEIRVNESAILLCDSSMIVLGKYEWVSKRIGASIFLCDIAILIETAASDKGERKPMKHFLKFFLKLT